MFAKTTSTEDRLWETFRGVKMELALSSNPIPISLSLPSELEPKQYTQQLRQLMRESKLASNQTKKNQPRSKLSAYFVIVIINREGLPIATVLQQGSLDFLGLDPVIWFFGGNVPVVQELFKPSDSSYRKLSQIELEKWFNEEQFHHELSQEIAHVFYWKTRLHEIYATPVTGNIFGFGKISVDPQPCVEVTRKQEFEIYPKSARLKRAFKYPPVPTSETDGNLPSACKTKTEQKKQTTFFQIITVPLTTLTATNWLFFRIYEAFRAQKNNPRIILTVKDSDACDQFLEQLEQFRLKALNSNQALQALNFVQEIIIALAYATSKQGPAFVSSGTLIVTHYWDQLFALSPFVREILNRIFYPGI